MHTIWRRYMTKYSKVIKNAMWTVYDLSRAFTVKDKDEAVTGGKDEGLWCIYRATLRLLV